MAMTGAEDTAGAAMEAATEAAAVTKEGVRDVQLSGFVDSAQSVKRAGEVARGVKGVTSVKNNLIVK
jgi:osmotically-inducible protein OsmY